MSAIKAVISDFGGVLTTPLLDAFASVQDRTGIPAAALGTAMQSIAEADGAHPLYELETGRLTEAEFLAKIEAALEPELGHRPEMHRFSEIYFEALEPNPAMIELMRDLRGRGYRMALLTNNIREWEPLWRSMLPVDEIFEVVVDSGFVGSASPIRRSTSSPSSGSATASSPGTACSSTTSRSTSTRRAELGMDGGPLS